MSRTFLSVSKDLIIPTVCTCRHCGATNALDFCVTVRKSERVDVGSPLYRKQRAREKATSVVKYDMASIIHMLYGPFGGEFFLALGSAHACQSCGTLFPWWKKAPEPKQEQPRGLWGLLRQPDVVRPDVFDAEALVSLDERNRPKPFLPKEQLYDLYELNDVDFTDSIVKNKQGLDPMTIHARDLLLRLFSR